MGVFPSFAVSTEFQLPTTVDVVIGAGQSNMSGRATYDSAVDLFTSNRFNQYGCRYDSANYKKLLTNEYPLEYTDAVQTGHIGAGTYFIRDYLANKTDRALCFIPAAQGSTSLVTGTTLWAYGSPTGDYYYEWCIARTNEALTALASQFATVNVVGIGWCQGENDQEASCTQAAYTSALIALAGGLRSRINGASGSWFAVLQMCSTFISTWGTAVDLAHQAAPSNISNCVFVAGPRGSQYDNGDNLHYGAAGQRILGASWYDAIKNL